MNSNNKIYTISADFNLEERLNQFNEELPNDEEIISVVSTSNNKLVITTRILPSKDKKNLLLEEVKGRTV
jgi:hypothetical protein